MRRTKQQPEYSDYDVPFPAQPRDEAPKYVRPKPPTEPTLDHLHGMAKARAWGENLVQDLSYYNRGRLSWSRVDHACVLHGPPGTGKTTFATALAASCKLPLIVTGYGNWQSSENGHLGDTMKAITADFDAAVCAAPCILFIDELDSLPKRAGGSRSDNYMTTVVNHMLTRLDSLKKMEGVIVVGACNHPDFLDPALVRAGRFDQLIPVELPTLEDIPNILLFHLGHRTTKNPPDLSDIAALCQSFSGADIERLVRNAERIARKNNREAVYKHDLIKAVEQDMPQLDQATRRRIAIHEAGHAVAAIRNNFGGRVSITLFTKDTLGATNYERPANTMTRNDVETLMTVLLAGRAAEDVHLNSVSSGAGGGKESDIAEATKLAIDSITRFGLSKNGLTPWVAPVHQYNLYYYPTEIRDEINQMLATAYERAVSLIKSNRSYVTAIADALLKKNALSHDDIIRCDPTPSCMLNFDPTTLKDFDIPPRQTSGRRRRPRE